MNPFKFSKDKQEMVDSLKRSAQNFDYDKKILKSRLLASISHRHLKADEKLEISNLETSLRVAAGSLRWRLAFGLALLFLFTTSGLTFAAANKAKPGDKLYPLGLMQEKIMLALPLKAEQKAKLRENIVAKRTLELEGVKSLINRDEVKLQAAKVSKDSLKEAVENISHNRSRLRSRGNLKTAEKLDAVLNRLEKLASEQEQRVGEIKEEVGNSEIRAKIEAELEEIKKARIRARENLDGSKNPSDAGNGGTEIENKALLPSTDDLRSQILP